MTTLIVFRVGHEEFALDVGRVAEVHNPVRTFAVPDLPEFLSGVIKVRGRLVPLVDMRLRLGVTPARLRERILVVRTCGNLVGLLVDHVAGIIKSSTAEMEKPPMVFKGLKREYISGIINRGQQAIIMLDVDNILTSDEVIRLEALKSSAKEPAQA